MYFCDFLTSSATTDIPERFEEHKHLPDGSILQFLVFLWRSQQVCDRLPVLSVVSMLKTDLWSFLIAVVGSGVTSSAPVWLATDQTVIFSKYPAVQITDVSTKQPGAAVHSCEQTFKKEVVHLSMHAFPARRGAQDGLLESTFHFLLSFCFCSLFLLQYDWTVRKSLIRRNNMLL